MADDIKVVKDNQIVQGVDLKRFKQMIKKMGYKVKTSTSNSWISGNTYTRLNVYDSDGKWVGGADGNVYTTEQWEKHGKLLHFMAEWRGRVVNTDYEPSIKVRF